MSIINQVGVYWIKQLEAHGGDVRRGQVASFTNILGSSVWP